MKKIVKEIKVKDLIGQELTFIGKEYFDYGEDKFNFYLNGNTSQSECMKAKELRALDKKNLFKKNGGIRFKFHTKCPWGKIHEKLKKARTDKKVFDSHGPLFEELVHKACNFAYEYLHGAYGLGQAVWYTYTEILILAKDGKLGFFGCNQWGEDLLFAVRCPKDWDNFQLINQPERIVESSVVAVSKYEPSATPRLFNSEN